MFPGRKRNPPGCRSEVNAEVGKTKKSIYSLVLSDDVVEAVDRLAANSGLSRSAMVNQFLAERVRCVTPEMRLKSITSAIRSAVGTGFFLTEQPSAATVACRTALKYRYKPTLRYSVEVYGAGNKRAGELRVTVRTQSEQLYADLSGFFKCWTALEQKYIADRLSQDIMFAIEPGRFTRTLNMPPEGITDDLLGQAVADYMAMLDEAMKVYFAQLPDTAMAQAAAEKSYTAAITHQQVII